MTIAIVSMIRDPWGGSEELWHDMAKEAIKMGNQVMHIRYEHPITAPKITELQSLGVQCFERPGYIPPAVSKLRRWLALVKNFIRKKVRSPFAPLFSFKPDIVIYNGTCYSIANEKELIAYINNKNPHFYIIGHLNADFMRGISEGEAARVKQAYSACKKVFFVSNRSLQNAERHLCASIPNGQVIKNPVNLDNANLISFPDVGDVVKFALVGNLVTSHKGQDILFHVFSKDQWKTRKWHLNIYGNGLDESYLHNLSRHFKIEGNVTFHGRVKNVRNIWAENHMLLMPSLMEGMPLAVVEAMLCGRPSLVTDVGGNSEWVEDGVSGFVVPVASVSALTEGLEKAWALRSRWPEMALAARNRALSLYDPKAGATLLEIIKEIHES